MPGEHDPITIVEQAYRLHPTDADWLRGVVDAIHPGLDRGMGLFALYFDVQGDHTIGRVHGAAATGAAESVLPAMRMSLPIAERAAVTEGIVYAPLAGTLTDTLAAEGPTRLSELAREFYRSLGFEDTSGITIADPTGFGCIVQAPMDVPGTMEPGERARWSRVAAHVTAALRLRRRLAAGEPLDDPDAAAAVLDPEGRVLHATHGAKSRDARTVLRDAVRAVERARSRHEDPTCALELWRGLVDGTWSVVDHFDRDGRRYLVAHRNDPRVKDPRALTDRERQVAAYVARGYANKLIAYYLGLSASTVAGHVMRVSRKLGCRNRVELVRLLRAMVPA